MGLAEDKKSFGRRFHGGSAAKTEGVVKSGFNNVLYTDELSFGSGEKCTRKIYFGETAPGTDYDAVAKPGDEYHQYTFTDGVVSAFKRYVYDGTNGWVNQTAAV